MPGQGGLHGDLGRFLIADFADEYYIGIVAQNRTQSPGESETCFFGDLDLVDSFELILNGIFNRNDLAH